MKIKHVVLIIIAYVILCVSFYVLCPKYYFIFGTGERTGFARCNKITGKIEIYDINGKWKNIK